MVQGRPVTILAVNNRVGAPHNALILFAMTILAIGAAAEGILHGKGLPLIFVARPVPTVHVPAIADAKILRHNEQSNRKCQYDEHKDNYERPKNMIFHSFFTPSTNLYRSPSPSAGKYPVGNSCRPYYEF